MQRRPPVTSLAFTPFEQSGFKPKRTPIFSPQQRSEEESRIRRSRNIRSIASRDYMLNSSGFHPSEEPYHFKAELDCVTVAQHVESCPICSRLYDTDKTLYILAIMGLLILCFLMVKHIIKF
jgi:hypothetical protein